MDGQQYQNPTSSATVAEDDNHIVVIIPGYGAQPEKNPLATHTDYSRIEQINHTAAPTRVH